MKELLKKKSAFFGEFFPLHFETRVGGGPLSLSLKISIALFLPPKSDFFFFTIHVFGLFGTFPGNIIVCMYYTLVFGSSSQTLPRSETKVFFCFFWIHASWFFSFRR